MVTLLRWKFAWVFALMMFGQMAHADEERDYTGFIGLYIEADDDGGVKIRGFIRNTPASKLNRSGSLNTGDVVTRLAGKRTDSIREFTRARDSIPFGKQGKMILRDRRGDRYYVWVGRKEPAVVRKEMEAAPASEGAGADNVEFGGTGSGDREPDIRDTPESDSSTDNPDIR